MVNKHGLKMVGIKDVASLTKGCERLAGTGYHIDIYYNMKTGRVWGCEHIGNSYTTYDDPEIIAAGSVKVAQTMQNIADRIYFNVREWAEWGHTHWN